MFWVYNFVQRLADGRLTSFRNDSQPSALRGRRDDMVEGWLFEEATDGSVPAYVRLAVFQNGVMYDPDITQVPHDILRLVASKMLMAA